MSKLPMLKAKDLIRVLKTLGFTFIRQKGSHAFFQHPLTGRSTIIPIHDGEDIDRSLLHAILKEIEISPEELSNLL